MASLVRRSSSHFLFLSVEDVKQEEGIHTMTSLLASQIICPDPNTPSAISLSVFMTWGFTSSHQSPFVINFHIWYMNKQTTVNQKIEGDNFWVIFVEA